MERMLVALGGTNYLDLILDSLARFGGQNRIEEQHRIAYVHPDDYERIKRESLYLSSVKLVKSGDFFTVHGTIRKDGGIMLGLCDIRHVDYVLERCKNCKDWVGNIGSGRGFGRCGNDRVRGNVVGGAEYPVFNGDFGCIHFESK